MSRIQALNVFRTCSASFSARNAARRSAPRAFAGVRYYSESQTQTDGASASQKEGNGEGKADDTAKTSPEAECLEKLKSKQAEVTDLTVCSPRFYCALAYMSQFCRVDYGTCRRIS